MKYSIERTTQFKRDFKLAERQGLNIDELEKVILMLANGEALPKEYRDHELKAKYIGHRECHIADFSRNKEIQQLELIDSLDIMFLVIGIFRGKQVLTYETWHRGAAQCRKKHAF